MDITIKVLKADVSNDQSFVCELAKQYDNLSRKYRILITDKGIPISLTGNESVLLRMKAENETEPYVEKWLDWELGYPIVNFTDTMLSKIGTVFFDFAVYDSPQSVAIISTRLQRMKIQQSLINHDGIIASEDFDILSSLINNALTIPALLDDINISIEEINTKIAEVNASMAQYEQQMQTYATEFGQMQTEQQAVIDALHVYMEDVENTAAAYATESKSWAIGTTGTRSGENTNCSKYFSDQSKTEADRSKTEADRAATYASMVAPNVYIDWENMTLVQSTEGVGITLSMDDDKVLSFSYT